MTYSSLLNRYVYWIVLYSLFLLFTIGACAQPRILPKRPISNPSARVGFCQNLQTIQNDRVKIGIDLCAGGAIAYLSTIRGENMINTAGLGRQAQIALYSGPNPYSENGVKPDTSLAGLGWNPVQAGDAYGTSSPVITFKKEDNLLYVKIQPRQYPLNNTLGEAYIENWIKLEGNVAKVHAKVTLFRKDTKQYKVRFQEMPCVYLNGNYRNVWDYQGTNPYTKKDSLTRRQPPLGYGESFQPTEPWMAMTNNNKFGVGLYVKDCYDWNRAYFGNDKKGPVYANNVAYMAANAPMILDHNIVHEWDYELIVGTVDEIRARVWSARKVTPAIDYQFSSSREGWYCQQAADAGWPIQGKLRVTLTDTKRDQILSPTLFWDANQIPKLYVRAAFKTQQDRFGMGWQSIDATGKAGLFQQLTFPIINDGEMHIYEIPLKDQTGWANQFIRKIRFQPVADGPPINGVAEIDWISTNGASVASSEPCTTICVPFTITHKQVARINR
jgi:hypothetical protein